MRAAAMIRLMDTSLKRTWDNSDQLASISRSRFSSGRRKNVALGTISLLLWQIVILWQDVTHYTEADFLCQGGNCEGSVKIPRKNLLAPQLSTRLPNVYQKSLGIPAAQGFPGFSHFRPSTGCLPASLFDAKTGSLNGFPPYFHTFQPSARGVTQDWTFWKISAPSKFWAKGWKLLQKY